MAMFEDYSRTILMFSVCSLGVDGRFLLHQKCSAGGGLTFEGGIWWNGKGYERIFRGCGPGLLAKRV